MRKVFLGFAVLMLAAVVVQFYLAAVGAFDTAPNDEAFDVHAILGTVILLLAVLATIMAAVAKVGGRLIGMTAGIAGLVLLQSLIRVLADALDDSGDTSSTAGTLVFGLHALNGLAILGLSGRVLAEARRPAASQQPPVAA
jgi:cytochrome b561